MTKFEIKTIIKAPIKQVWDTLADIGSIHVWNPGVIDSYTTNDIDGLGGTRHCDLKGNMHLKEEVVKYEPETAITFRITSSNMPFKTADIHFNLSKVDEGTEVSVSPEYELKYGPLGSLMDKVMVQSTYKKGMVGLLNGLKQNVEGQVEVN